MLRWPTFVIARRINRATPDLTLTLFDPNTLAVGTVVPLHDGALQIDTRFNVTAFGAPSWRARGRLLDKRGRRVASVELELGVWSAYASELSVRPTALHPERWGARRLRRYFALAHDAADSVTRVLLVGSAPASETPKVRELAFAVHD